MNNIDLIGDDACVKQLVTDDFSNTNGVYIDDGVQTIGSSAFENCSNLTSVDFPIATSIGGSAFQYCSKLTSLILRKSDTICTLSNANSFYNTLIESGTGYIYVPRALVDSYKAASKWSTYANQFRALEDYTVDGTITGALDSSKI